MKTTVRGVTKEKKGREGKRGSIKGNRNKPTRKRNQKKKTRVRSKEVGRERKPVVNVQRTPIYLQQQEVEYHFFLSTKEILFGGMLKARMKTKQKKRNTELESEEKQTNAK